MRKLFSGKVFDLLPLANGAIFSYEMESIEEGTVVAYKMISFETGSFTDVARNVYLLTKFGNRYKAIVPFCDNYITVKSLLLPNGKVFLLEKEGRALLVDNDATVIWQGEIQYRGYPAADTVLYKNVLWACFAEQNVLLRYNLSTMREELRIGGNKSPFDRPESLFVEDDTVVIANAGSQKLLRVDLNSYSVSEEETFKEPVHSYVNAGKNRFVILESGLYLL